jgi:STE24 endopeptidase
VTERRPRWTWVGAVVAAVIGVGAITLRAPLPPPPGPSVAADALVVFDAATLARVADWVGPIRVAYLIGLVIALGVPWWLVVSARGQGLVDRVGGTRFATARGAVLAVLASALMATPLRWWIGWWHAGAFGFRTSSPLRFVTEAAGSIAIETLVTVTAALLLLWVIRRRGSDWPAVGTLLGTLATAGLVLVQPLVVTSLLYDPAPLDDPVVEAAVGPVVARSTLPDLELLVGAASVRTTRVNAYVTGIGPTRQVVLWDTLLALPTDRVVSVVGHEIAHAEHNDLARGVIASAAGILPALLLVDAVRRRQNARGHAVALSGARAGAMAVAVVVTLQLLGQPVVAWQSRRVEAAADARTFELVRDPAGFVGLSRGFVERDLSDPNPPAWVRLMAGTHPTAQQRIRAAVAFAEREGLDPTPDGGDGP